MLECNMPAGKFFLSWNMLVISIIIILTKSYSSVQVRAPLTTYYIYLRNNSTADDNYIWKDRPLVDPRCQNKPVHRFRPSLRRTLSPKMSKSQDQLLNAMRRNGNVRRANKLLVRKRLRSSHGIGEIRCGRRERSGRRSRFNDKSDLRSLTSLGFFWEPIFDGKIIAAIGSLFTKSVKDESNRERLERKKARETRLLQMYTNIINDPVQLELLKKQSAGSSNYVNQIVL